MAADAALRDLAQDCGLHRTYQDMSGQWHDASPSTLRAMLGGLGVEARSAALARESLKQRVAARAERRLPIEHVVLADHACEIPLSQPCEWIVTDEQGGEVQAGRSDSTIAFAALPVGFFTLIAHGPGWQEDTLILSRPASAPSLFQCTGNAQSWGFSGTLYGLSSDTNGGLGNYADLACAVSAMGRSGAQFYGFNPVHTLGWDATDVISPYSPSHRGFFNIDHVALDSSLGAGPEGDLIDYAGFRTRHRAGLEAEYKAFVSKQPSDQIREHQRYCDDGGAALIDFSVFEALSEQYGSDFRTWPKALRSPCPAAIKAAGARAGFHCWLQWRADTQILSAQHAAQAAGMSLGLYLDLAVGSRLGGAEVWMNQDTIAQGVSLGAPPDHLSPEGQSWCLAAHAPNKMAASHYRPLRTMLRKLMTECGLLRIDHALGLLRSFWLPEDGSPGGYVSQPFETLLAVIAIEAWKNGCVIVGEDLGLVPDGFREQLNGAGLYSYAVWQYETGADGRLRPPHELRPNSLACFGTHDTPTLAGFWHGVDITWWQQLGWINAAQAQQRHGARAHQRIGLRASLQIPLDAKPADVAERVHASLLGGPTALVAIQVDDLFCNVEAENLPGTIHQHPNWRRKMPVSVEHLDDADPLARIRDVVPSTRIPNTPKI